MALYQPCKIYSICHASSSSTILLLLPCQDPHTQTHYKRLQGLAYKTPYSLIFFSPPFMLNQGKTISFTPVHGHVHSKNSVTCQKYLAPCSMKIHFKKNNDLFFSILWCVAAHFISSDVWLPFIYCLKNKHIISDVDEKSHWWFLI